MFSEEPLASDARNHAVPVFDVLQSPSDSSKSLMVMPWLVTFWDTRFDTFGEAVDCIQQLIEVRGAAFVIEE